MDIRDSEKRRARNLIWNAAEEYGFEPDFKAYDQEGQADLYWNSIIGAVRKNYGTEAPDRLFAAFHGSEQQALYEQLVWLGLESAAFAREAPNRPALPYLRRRYAREVLGLEFPQQENVLLTALERGHFLRALGQDPGLSGRELEMLDALEFPADEDGDALTDRALNFLRTYFGFVPGGEQPENRRKRRQKRGLFGKKKAIQGQLTPVRQFGFGFGEHLAEENEGQTEEIQTYLNWSGLSSTDQNALKKYIRTYFGQPLYDEQKTKLLEQQLCVDEHGGCHLYYSQGSNILDKGAKGYVGAQRKAALKQMEKNRDFYYADIIRNRNSVNRLTARIYNALLTHLEPVTVRSATGTLDAGRLWRGLYLDDDKVFTRVLRTDPGDLSVDILLDASNSQVNRQQIVAAQGYMIAESLTRCGIPVRVSAFCSLSGYTVLTRFRDYRETDKNERIFRYFTTGCNRDGLAVRAVGLEMEDSPCEHRMLILLSDAKPHDIRKLKLPEGDQEYGESAGVNNTAAEVRSLLHRNIAVLCVFTGDDSDIPAAHTIYGRDFARIRSLDQFADTVGTLIQNQIRNL